MYVELHNYQDIEQKVLFFKLKTAINLDNIDGVEIKKVGIYAIYKSETCLYVGQSTNIASRLATHIKGKFEEASHIYFFDIESIGFSDFKERSKESQKLILDNCERYVMAILKPIENINIDMSFTLDKLKIPDMFFRNYKYIDFEEIEDGFESISSFRIDILNRTLCIYNKLPEFSKYVFSINSSESFIESDKDRLYQKALSLYCGDMNNNTLGLRVDNIPLELTNDN